MGRYFYQRMSRVFSVMLAGLLWGQCLFAYQPEKTIWDQRRAAARAARAVLVASRSDGTHSSSPLAAQFPPVQSACSSLSPSISCSLPLPFLRQHEALLGALSPAYGTVRKVALGGPSGRGRLVIHIQDVHQNFEAQWNIRSAVSDLLKSGRVGLVALEGSAEPIDLQPFVDFPHRKAMEKVADLFLKENRISGPIHAAITAEGRLPRMLGIEDPLHYEANVKAVRDSAPRQEEMRELTRTIQTEIDHQKKTVFSPALLDLDRTITDYRNEKISLGVYLETLAERDAKGVGSGKFPAVRDFLRALGMERSLDFARVETERGRLIEKLTQALSADEISSLMNESMAYRAGHRRFADFYSGLKTLCQKKNIRLSEFPAMDAYIRYVLLADRINPELLMSEMVQLEKYAVAQIARSAEEKALAQRSRVVWLAGRLADFALTPAEWAEWAAAGENLGLDLFTFESFYREALARDGAMAENLWAATNPGEVAVLVTGGFHGDGLARELGRRGVTVVSYVPKIEKVDTIQGAAYLSVFSQEKTPLEKLFRGEKLFLGANPIAPQERHIALPAAAVLTAISAIGILVGFDFQQAYAGLGGVGAMRDVALNSGAAQAVVGVGAGALMIKLMTNGGRVGPLEIYPNSKGSWAGSVGWVQRYWDKVKTVVTEEMVGVVENGKSLTFWRGFFKSFQGRVPAVMLGLFLPAMAGVPYIWLIFGPALIFVAVGQIIFLKDHGDMSPRQMVVRAVGILLLNGIAFFGPVIMGGMALGVAPETAVELVVRFGEGIGLAVAAHLVWNGIAEWGKNKLWEQDYRLVGGKNDNGFPENVQLFPLVGTANIIAELQRVKGLSNNNGKPMIVVVDQGDVFKDEYLGALLSDVDDNILAALFGDDLNGWTHLTDSILSQMDGAELKLDKEVEGISSWVNRTQGVLLVMKPVNLLFERPVFQRHWFLAQDPFYKKFQEKFSVNNIRRETIAHFLLPYEGLELAKGEFLKDTFFRAYLKSIASNQNRPNVLALVRKERFGMIANDGTGQEPGSNDLLRFKNYTPEDDPFKQLVFLCREWLKSQPEAKRDLLEDPQALNNFVALFPDGITPMHDAAARTFLLRWVLAQFKSPPESGDQLRVGAALAKLDRNDVLLFAEGIWNDGEPDLHDFWAALNYIDSDINTKFSGWLKNKLSDSTLGSEGGSPGSFFFRGGRLVSAIFGKSESGLKKTVAQWLDNHIVGVGLFGLAVEIPLLLFASVSLGVGPLAIVLLVFVGVHGGLQIWESRVRGLNLSALAQVFYFVTPAVLLLPYLLFPFLDVQMVAPLWGVPAFHLVGDGALLLFLGKNKSSSDEQTTRQLAGGLADALDMADQGNPQGAAKRITELLRGVPEIGVENIFGPKGLGSLEALTQSRTFSEAEFQNQFQLAMQKNFPNGMTLPRSRRAVAGLAIDRKSQISLSGLGTVDLKKKKGLLVVVTKGMLKDLARRMDSFEKAARGKPVYWVAENVSVFNELQKLRPLGHVFLRPSLVDREGSVVIVSGRTLERVVKSQRILQDFAIALPRDSQVDMEGVSKTSVLRNVIFYFLDDLLVGVKMNFTTLHTIDKIARRIAFAA